MAIIDHIDLEARRIYLSAATVGVDFNPMNAYKEMRTLRATNEQLRKGDVFMKGGGHIYKGGVKYTERYVTLLKGTRFVPYDATQVLTIVGTVITDEGTEGIQCFDRNSLTVTTVVDLVYIPPQVEVIEISTGSGLSAEESTKLLSIPTATENATAVANDLLY